MIEGWQGWREGGNPAVTHSSRRGGAQTTHKKMTPTNCLVLFVMRMRAVYVVNCLVMFVIRMQMAFTVVVMHVLVCVSLSRSCWTKRPVAVLILIYCGIKHAFGRCDIVRLWQAACVGY